MSSKPQLKIRSNSSAQPMANGLDGSLTSPSQRLALNNILSKAINRYLHLIHRWFGIVIGLFVLLWFFSGAVMMYMGYPELTQTERRQALTEINKTLIKKNAYEAWQSTQLNGVPEEIRLSSEFGRPAYYFLHDNIWHSVWADTGEYRINILKDEAARAAQNFISNHGFATSTTLIKTDQWSLSSGLNPHRPLYKVELNDPVKSILYVSSHTGEVVRDTTQWERGWNWVGSVIHWIYFTPLRIAQEPWRQIVMWTSGAAFFLIITGVWLGIQRLRLKKRYSGGRISPYRGWKRWHHLVGLASAVFAITWIFSGWLSVNPFEWFSTTGLTQEERLNFAGGSFNDTTMKANIASVLNKSSSTVEVQWKQIGGQSFLILYQRSSSKIFNISNSIYPEDKLPLSFLIETIQRAKPNTLIQASQMLEQGDLYYYSHHNKRALPILRVDFADKVETSVYINPATGKIEASEDNSSRVYRWLYNGLHCLDFPLLITKRPLWDIVVMTLLAIGAILSISGVVLAVKRVSRK